MAQHPYQNLPDWNYWKRSVSALPADQVDPVIQGKFRISASDRVATAGSCFAQHIARHLKVSGFNYFVSEQAPPIVSQSVAEQYNYGLFTARYGNIYTSRQLVQLLRRAYGLFQPVDDVWPSADGYFIDPFRPQIQPRGFASMAEYSAARQQHFAAVRRAVEQLDVLIFTLGLTETWICKADGAAYPLCPGVAGGDYDEAKYAFVNLRAAEVISDLQEAVRFIRERNPQSRFIFTVSPVPLIATAEPQSVIVSNTYSKSVLRVAADEIAHGDERIAYFPSFEIITGNHTHGRYFANDLRSVTEEGVRRVMALFMQHYTDVSAISQSNPQSDAARERLTEEQNQQAMASLASVMCDEEALDK